MNSETPTPLGHLPPRAAKRAAASFSRRAALAGSFAICAGNALAHESEQITLYSPAPPATILHALNVAVRDCLVRHGVGAEVTALALPDSVNQVADRPMAERALHLPIVTTVDLPLARAGAGPAWHAYPRASADLKFIAKLYDVGFGVQVIDPRLSAPNDLRGRRIGAPARPSAVRLLTETLLRDGWNIFEHVTLVDLAPSQAAAALANGEVDAITWNLVTPTAEGPRPMLPAPHDARFLAVTPESLARINAANTFQFDFVQSLAGQPPLLSFAQALAAWDETPAALITDILHALAADGRTAADMARWPALTAAGAHPAARAFYAAHNIPLT